MLVSHVILCEGVNVWGGSADDRNVELLTLGDRECVSPPSLLKDGFFLARMASFTPLSTLDDTNSAVLRRLLFPLLGKFNNSDCLT